MHLVVGYVDIRHDSITFRCRAKPLNETQNYGDSLARNLCFSLRFFLLGIEAKTICNRDFHCRSVSHFLVCSQWRFLLFTRGHSKTVASYLICRSPLIFFPSHCTNFIHFLLATSGPSIAYYFSLQRQKYSKRRSEATVQLTIHSRLLHRYLLCSLTPQVLNLAIYRPKLRLLTSLPFAHKHAQCNCL